MTSQFDGFEQNQATETFNQETESKTDRFELLSAFIDGELSPTERNQVQAWLDQDPEIKQLYTQLLALQCQIQHSVVPSSTKSVAEITTGVFDSIDRHRRQRKLVWGGSAIAASLLAAISLIPGIAPPGLRIAEQQSPADGASPVMLAVAINQPTVNIPKAINGHHLETQQPLE
ncbi:MAG: anti-sigma factor family protein [Pleurocapsa sp.]